MSERPQNAFVRFTTSNLTARFLLIRLICVSSLALTAYALADARSEGSSIDPVSTLVPSITFLYLAFTTVFGPRFCLPNVIDLGFLLAAAAGALFTNVWIDSGDNVTTQWAIASSAWAGILVLSLVLFSILRIIVATSLGRKCLMKRLDVSNVDWIDDRKPTLAEEGEKPTTKTTRTPIQRVIFILFGSLIWKERFPGEASWLKILRGIMAILFLLAIVIYAVVNILVGPVRETYLTPSNMLRATALPADLSLSDQPIWNIMVTQVAAANDTSVWKTDFRSAVTVISDDSNCSSLPMTLDYALIPYITPFAYGAAFACPTQNYAGINKLTPDSVRQDLLAFPEALVTVNFTAIGMLSNSSTNVRLNSVEIRPTLINDFNLAMQWTRPVTLLPGSNLVAIASLRVRQIPLLPSLSALGGLNPVRTFLSMEVIQVLNDPVQASTIQRAPDIGTIRIVPSDIFTNWEIFQDQHESTILKGFSVVGGLWSFFGGVFIWLFGSSLLRVLRGTKPITVFGVLHTLQRNKEMRETCLEKYPKAKDDIQAGDGLLAVLHDHLFDIGFLVGNDETKASSPYSPLPSS